jgi:hypothetical protein
MGKGLRRPAGRCHAEEDPEGVRWLGPVKEGFDSSWLLIEHDYARRSVIATGGTKGRGGR